MIVLRINNADLPTGWTHDKTDWQVSTDESFKDILVKSMDDEENLTTIIFNEKLDLGKKYYGRARMLLNTGFTEWSNIDVFIPKDANEVALNMDIPSIITAPTLTTKYEKDSHPNAYFKILGNEFSTLGNATHESTTWIVEDSEGTALWASIDDKDNLTSVLMDRYLPKNTVCHVHAAYKGSNGDISQFGTVSFYLSNDDRIVLHEKMKFIPPNVDLYVTLPFMEGLDTLEWEFLLEGEVVESGTTTECFFNISKDNLNAGVANVLRVRTTINSKRGEWTYTYVEPFNEDLELPTGDNIPYNGNNEQTYYPLDLPIKFVSNED